jgi:uncharacterized protein YbjT (DUF2867 family)
LARHPEFLLPRVAPSTEVVMGDGLDQTSLPPAMAGVHTAHYLVHSMGSSSKCEEQDRQSVRNFADSARQAGVRRIIYLGGLGAEGQSLSAHLRSRQEVADILRSSEVPTIEFRASIVIRTNVEPSPLGTTTAAISESGSNRDGVTKPWTK